MNKNIKELLPIGSVVLLEGAEKALMIFGVMQSDLESDTEYDYISVLYPEGNMGSDSQVLFNHENIEKVLFRGYEDYERDEFIDSLIEFYKS